MRRRKGQTAYAGISMARSRFFYVRVAVLLTVLVVVLLFAASRWLRDRARAEWNRPQRVAFVIVPIGPVEAAPIAALAARKAKLEEVLTHELHRRRPTPDRPFQISVRGPAALAVAPPEPEGDGYFDLAAYAWHRWRWTRAVDASLSLDTDAYDSRIYVAVHAPVGKTEYVEGASDQGGHVGVVSCYLDASTIDWALAVATHELMHTLGATDKYDLATGLPLVPDGLAEPQREPLYPQRAAEVMARGVPLGPTTERPLAELDELKVGDATAREIGWLAPP